MRKKKVVRDLKLSLYFHLGKSKINRKNKIMISKYRYFQTTKGNSLQSQVKINKAQNRKKYKK